MPASQTGLQAAQIQISRAFFFLKHLTSARTKANRMSILVLLRPGGKMSPVVRD